MFIAPNQAITSLLFALGIQSVDTEPPAKTKPAACSFALNVPIPKAPLQTTALWARSAAIVEADTIIPIKSNVPITVFLSFLPKFWLLESVKSLFEGAK